MAKFTEAERQRILKAYQRVRTLRLLISLPILAGAFLLAMVVRNPEYHIGEFHGLALALPAGVLIAIGLILHFRFVRCPACGKLLSRALYCRHCGALFTS